MVFLTTVTSSFKKTFTTEKDKINKFRNKYYFCVLEKENVKATIMAKYNVKKANHLVKLEEKMSKAAQLWVSYLVACLPKSKAGVDDFPTLQFSFREIKKAINADGKKRIGKKADVFKIIKELMYTPLWYENEKQRGYVAWLTEVFEDKTTEGEIFNFVFHPKLKPYLLNLENKYTIYNYFYRVCLSTNSMKVYEILKSYQYMGQVDLNIEKDLKEKLGLKGKYDKFYDFKKKVLNVAQKELRQFTDISFEYEVSKKEWNKAISLFIVIRKNEPTNLPEPLLEFVKRNKSLPSISETIEVKNNLGKGIFKEQFPEIYSFLSKLGGSEEVITKLISDYGVDSVKYQLEHVKRKIKQKAKINDAFGWFRKAVQENYQDPVQHAKAKKEETMKKNKKIKAEAKNVEEAIIQLNREKYDNRKKLADKFIKADGDLLDKVIQEIKSKNTIVREKINKGLSNQEIYSDIIIKGSVIQRIAEYFPDDFKVLDSQYDPKIQKLKRLR